MSTVFGTVVRYKNLKIRYCGTAKHWEVCNMNHEYPDKCGSVLMFGNTVIEACDKIDEMLNRIETLKNRKRQEQAERGPTP